jgi:hypothetical protein
MAVNIDGDTGIDKVQPGSVDGVDLSDGSVSSPKLDTNIAVTGTLSAGGTVTAPAFSGDGSSLTGIAGGFSNMQVFTSPGTWTNPGNVNKVKVTVVGGGGGGFSYGEPTGCYSGGAGGAAIEVIPFPTATNVAVTRGAGANQGGTGGTSSFGAYCSATGGGGGKAPLSNTGQALPAGGSGSGGGINISGGGGQGFIATSGRAGMVGGQSIFGGGYGAGGELGKEVPVNVVGQPGVIIVEY